MYFNQKLIPTTNPDVAMSRVEAELREHQLELEMQNDELRRIGRLNEILQQKYYGLYNLAPVGILSINAEGKIVEANAQAANLLGVPQAELANKVFSAFLNDEHSDQDIFHLHRRGITMDTPRQSCELRLKNRSTGAVLWVELNEVLAPAIDNEKLFQTVITDITERKVSEQSLIESERLGAIVEVAAGVAHDFNNCLQGISSNLNLLQSIKTELPTKSLRWIDSAQKGVRDGAARVKRFRSFALPQKTHTEHQPLLIMEVLTDAIAQTTPLWKDEAERNGIFITMRSVLGVTPSIDGSKEDLRSVFFNLIKNSIESMPQGGNINIVSGTENQQVFIRVTDTGIGMDAVTIKKIFQPFFTTKGHEPGRGLGMASVFKTINDHGGRIRVKESVVGQGTTMEVFLPIGVKTVCQVTDADIKHPFIPAKVLWVDDDELIRAASKEQLEYLGHQGSVAAGGLEALVLMSRNVYDLVLSDIGMPDMNGWQLAEKIKDTCGTKVVMISGWGDQEPGTKEKMEKYGICCVLAKPFDRDQLDKIIQKVMQEKLNKGKK